MATLSIPVSRTFQSSFKPALLQDDQTTTTHDVTVMGADVIRIENATPPVEGKSFATIIG